jgi:hypothetical protein
LGETLPALVRPDIDVNIDGRLHGLGSRETTSSRQNQKDGGNYDKQSQRFPQQMFAKVCAHY